MIHVLEDRGFIHEDHATLGAFYRGHRGGGEVKWTFPQSFSQTTFSIMDDIGGEGLESLIPLIDKMNTLLPVHLIHILTQALNRDLVVFCRPMVT